MTNQDRATWNAQMKQRAAETLRAARAHPARPAAVQLGAQELAAMIDHTILKADATSAAVRQVCAEAKEFGFASVCVNSANVALCVEALRGSNVPVCSVVGFPLGASLTAVKAFEARQAIEAGATEIDMVINIGALKDGDYALVKEDIAGVVDACHQQGAICKVIIETAYLTDEEKVAACLLIVEAGADYCKTSTGLASAGATVEDVALMRAVVGPDTGVKAAGGIRSYDDAVAMVAAGASRIGASASVKIVQGAPADQGER
jgi:deoxyribose-phosphate aldolase